MYKYVLVYVKIHSSDEEIKVGKQRADVFFMLKVSPPKPNSSLCHSFVAWKERGKYRLFLSYFLDLASFQALLFPRFSYAHTAEVLQKKRNKKFKYFLKM